MGSLKTRNIVVEGNSYLWVIQQKIKRFTHPQIQWKTSVRIYLSGFKSTPFKIHFYSPEDWIGGNFLFMGVDTTLGELNVNRPAFIESVIRQVIEMGWDGSKMLEIQNGKNFLRKMGYTEKDLNFLVEEQ